MVPTFAERTPASCSFTGVSGQVMAPLKSNCNRVPWPRSDWTSAMAVRERVMIL